MDLLELAPDLFFNVLAPILVMCGFGALLRWKFAIDLQTLTKLNIWIFTPAFVFERVVNSDVSWDEMGLIALVTAGVTFIMGLITYGVGVAAGVSRKTLSALAMASMFYNSGNFGIPLAELAFPEFGGAVQAFVLLPQSMLTFTVGLFIAAGADSGGTRGAIVKVFKLPVIYTLVTALAVRAYLDTGDDLALPTWISETARYLSAGLVPVALVTLGAQLASNPRWPRWKPVAFVMVLRLAIGPLVAAGLCGIIVALGRDDFWSGPARVLILTAGVPTAVNTLLLTLELDGDPDIAADCVFWTTLASMVTVLLWLATIRWYLV